MTKYELHTGMVVTLRNGNKMNVYTDVYNKWNDKNLLTDGESWISLSEYTSEMTHPNNDFDIVRVESIGVSIDLCRNPCVHIVDGELWLKEEPKRMTVSEIESLLGCKVEIVAEK